MKRAVSLRGLSAAVGLALSLAAIPSIAQARSDGTVPCGDTAKLIEEIKKANTAGSGTITLVAGCTYGISNPFNDNGNLENGLPPIKGKIKIIVNDNDDHRHHHHGVHGVHGVHDDNGDNDDDDDKRDANATIMRASRTPFRIFKVLQGGELSLRGITVSAGDTPGDGGGIFDEGGTVNLEGSKIIGNRAANDGGGIANENGTVIFEDSKVAGNTSDDDGGGISNNAAGTVKIDESSILCNTTNQDGGGINSKGTVTIRESVVAGNVARGDDGGGINDGGSLTVIQSKIVFNKAGLEGGGINVGENSQLTVGFSSVSDNTAGRDGAGINNEGNARLTGVGVTGNSAGRNGGGINNERGGMAHSGHPRDGADAVLTIEDSKITRNTASAGKGGGIFNQPPATVTLRDVEIEDNRPDNCFPAMPGCED